MRGVLNMAGGRLRSILISNLPIWIQLLLSCNSLLWNLNSRDFKVSLRYIYLVLSITISRRVSCIQMSYHCSACRLLREMLHIVPNHIMDHTKLMLFKWMETGYSGDRSNLLLVIRYLFVDSLIYLCLKYTNPTNPIGIDAREGGGCHSRALISLPPDNICLVSWHHQ